MIGLFALVFLIAIDEDYAETPAEGIPSAPASSSPDTPRGAEWEATVRKASAELKPILVFAHPEPCAKDEKIDPCEKFLGITSHPAMQRRLADLVFLEWAMEPDQEVSVSVYDPSGALAIRWFVLPDLKVFLKMLALVDGATPYMIKAHQAGKRGQRHEQSREWALAMLALGKAVQGRQLLEALSASTELEDRQLAAIWLAQLDAYQQKVAPPEDLVLGLSANGATERVLFEAWMALGNLRFSSGRIDDAVEAYGNALESAPEGMRDAAFTALRRAEETASSILGLGPSGSVVVGRRTIQPRSIGQNVDTVEFRLDGRLVATAKRAPFTSSIHFGKVPQRQILEFTALDKAGNVQQRSRAVVNQRSDEFSIRIVEPSSSELSGSVEVGVDLQVPRGRKIESVLVEWNGQKVSLLTSAPYRTSLEVESGEQGILRTVLRLDDGSEVEDVLLANSGSMTFESAVNLVELPVYTEKGTLTLKGVSVKEEGTQRQVDRVIPSSEAPLRIAMVLDASGSMGEHILDVQEAAIRFVETQLDDRDQVMVVAFNESARVLWPTSDRRLIEKAILAIQTRGNTALNDALTLALLQIPSSGSRRALVIFSDGMDTASLLSSRDVAEVSRRSGVPIYVLSLRPASVPHAPRVGRDAVMKPSPDEVLRRERRRLEGLGRNTGGLVFDLESLDRLSSMWNDIGEDLRRQSLVIYRTEPSAQEWRRIEISMRGEGQLRAPEGVYVAIDRTQSH